MNQEDIRLYCLAKPGVTESLPFDDVSLVFKVMNKMFALVSLERLPLQANLKADPERVPELREQWDGRILPGYHMNKDHWNTVLIGQLPADLIRELIDHSYQLIAASLPKKVRVELEGME